MRITKVKVEYSELKSFGYNNKKYCIGYEAEVGEGESPSEIRQELMEKAMTEVKRLHGDVSDNMVIKTYMAPKEENPW